MQRCRKGCRMMSQDVTRMRRRTSWDACRMGTVVIGSYHDRNSCCKSLSEKSSSTVVSILHTRTSWRLIGCTCHVTEKTKQHDC